MDGRPVQAGSRELCHGAVTGYGERREALGQSRASLPLHRAFAHCLLGLQLVQGKTQSLRVLLVLDEAPGFGVTCVVTASRTIPKRFVLAQVYNCWGWAPASC